MSIPQNTDQNSEEYPSNNITEDEMEKEIENILKRKQIKLISSSDISEDEKRLQIQKLHFNDNQSHLLIPEVIECDHYIKKCSDFIFSCCDKKWPCQKCHQNCKNYDKATSLLLSITCNECKTVQSPSNKCRQCKIKFSKNYCRKCDLWTSRNINHCNKCGMCRIGTKKTLKHCNKCNICYRKTTHGHRCSGRNLKNIDCSICGENLHSSDKQILSLHCSHIFHRECIEASIEAEEYRCPDCRKSMMDMSEKWDLLETSIIMQPMAKSKFVDCLCYDCNSVSEQVLYHYLGLQCIFCAGFNTSEK